MRIALAQMDTVVGDLEGNASKIARFIKEAEDMGAELVCFPELSLPGYPPEDLVFKTDFVRQNMEVLGELAKHTGETVAVVGTLYLAEDLFNAAAVLYGGRVQEVYFKNFLPNYGVFDEMRYFAPGREGLVLELGDTKIGITICEDIWYPGGPLEFEVAYGGAEIVINLSSSPFQKGKHRYREEMLSFRARENGVVIAYVNRTGGQDELVFDGGSMIFHPEKGKLASAARFREELMVADVEWRGAFRKRTFSPIHRHFRRGTVPGTTRSVRLDGRRGPRAGKGPRLPLPVAEELDEEEEVLQALLVGLRDYVAKNRFEHVLVGLSGGVDSALVAALATLALGSSRVHGVFMPSIYTSSLSRKCVDSLRESLGIEVEEYPIDGIYQSYLKHGLTSGPGGDVASENLQARIRGNILMTISNSRGWLVLSTGNKSELSMGYCTLYGDMVGGFSLIKDLYKTEVYRLSRHINEKFGKELIPEEVITREPTAELKEGQLDTDSLPPYESLDPVLRDYVEKGMSLEEMVSRGHDPQLVMEVIRRVDANEFKRRQAPVGVKITSRAFGRDWRLPISSYRG